MGGAVLAGAVVCRLGEGGELKMVGVGGVEPLAALLCALYVQAFQGVRKSNGARHDVLFEGH